MTGIVDVTPGAIVSIDELGTYVVSSFESPNQIRIREMSTGAERLVELTELRSKSSSFRASRPDLASLSEKQFQEAQTKYLIIKPLIDLDKCGVDAIQVAAASAEVSPATIYRWIKEFREGRVMSSIVRKPRSDAGKSRLTDVVEAIVADVIAEYWLTPQKRSYAKAHREVTRRCRNANVKPPSLPTLVARASRISPKDVAKKRHGKAAADKLNLINGTVPNVTRPYSVIQIDHTLVDIELVDSEHRVSIGRPWITVAIDVYSRMIVGWYISFDPPGMLGTGICIANAILPKSAMMAALGVNYDYPCVGKPRIIHLDNAKEFHSLTLDRACQEYGIDLHYRKVATPRYGGHIERLMGTFAEEIKTLDGATFSNHLEKGDYDSAKRATFTLQSFEKWIAHLFLGVYHQRVHTALQEPPLRKYTKAFLGTEEAPFPGLVEYIPDEQRLRLDFLPMFDGTIQSYGVKIDHITYAADVLRRWVGAKDPKAPTKGRKFIFRRDPRDISYLYFYDPDAKTHFKIPYRDRSHPLMSLWELRAVRKFLADQGRASVNESEIFRAFDAMREIEVKEQQKTTKVRRSHAAKRGLRRKESPQPVLLVDSTKPSVPAYIEIQHDLDVKTVQDGFDEIERY